MMDIFIARQPIFNVNQDAIAYEILYRSGFTNAYDGIDGDKASRDVIINTFQTFGTNNLTNNKPVFINFTENLICDEIATLFPNDLLVIEILEDVYPHKGIIERCKKLKEMGYRIALDDFVNKTEYKDLIELADIIKIDFFNTEKEEIENILHELKDKDIEFLAEKVETREEFQYAKELGFKYFQGYFFSKPEVLRIKKLQHLNANCLQLVDQINQAELDFDKLVDIISRDLSLIYNLLKLVNSPAFGFRYKIKTVKHGVVALGEREIKKWINLLVLTEMGSDKPDELTRLSVIRAKFLELLYLETGLKGQTEDVFLVGLLSLMDVIVNRPLKSILKDIKASNLVVETLLKGTGEIIDLYKLMIAYEKGQWEEVLKYNEKFNIDNSLIIMSYMNALRWYNDLM